MQFVIWILIGMTVLVLTGSIAIYLVQPKLLFYPSRLPASYEYPSEFPFQELDFAMADGSMINGVRFRVPSRLGVILYFHGNAGSLDTWAGVASDFVPLGYELLIIDYRGFGKSTGAISEEALLNDGLAVYDEIANEVEESEIIVYGRSIGSAPAVYVAANRSPGALILESPFYSMRDLVRHRFPMIPGILLRFPLRNDLLIEQVESPVFLFHGTEDQVIYYESSLKLHTLVPGARLFLIEGGRHNDLPNSERYRVEIRNILGQLAGPKR